MLSAFLLSISKASATSPSTISGSDTAPVSVSVSNSPLAYYISVSSSHGSAGTPVSLNYSQDGSSGGILGNVVSSSDNVYLETNSPLNHQLLLSTTSPSTTTKSNNLTGDNTQESGGIPVLNTYIAPVGNTTTSSLNSATTLSSNTWGFALSSTTPGIATNNFNTASEYESESQATINSNRYTTVPTNNNQVLLLQDTEPTSTTTIYYGVKADRDIPAGSYSNTVLYTALAEQPSEIRVSGPNGLNPTIDLNSPHQTLTIYTSINTTSSELGTATVSFTNSSNKQIDTCSNVVLNTDSDNYLYLTCTSPAMPADIYDVTVTLDTFGRVLEADDVVTYSGTPPINTITTMQTLTADACKTAPFADAAGNNVYTLRDTRDGNTYKVAHLLDNNCWMVQNLKYNNGSSENTGSYAGTGRLYNWPLANNACPSRWTLPTRTHYTNMLQPYQNISSVENAPLYFIRAGMYNSNGYSDQGVNGWYWTSSERSSGYAYLYYYNTSTFPDWSYKNINFSYSVRCVFGS